VNSEVVAILIIISIPCPEGTSGDEEIKPEAKYKGSGKHGVKWKEGKATAKKTGKPLKQTENATNLLV